MQRVGATIRQKNRYKNDLTYRERVQEHRRETWDKLRKTLKRDTKRALLLKERKKISNEIYRERMKIGKKLLPKMKERYSFVFDKLR